MKQSRVNTALPREHNGHSKHLIPTAQKMTLHVAITRKSTLKSDRLYSLKPKMKKLYIVSKKQDLEMTVAQIISSLLQNSGLKDSRKNV